MKHLTYSESTQFELAILIKETALNKDEIYNTYIKPIGINKDKVLILSLDYNEFNKAPSSLIKSCSTNIIKALKHFDIKLALIADSSYFKYLAKVSKAEPNLGNRVKSVHADIDLFLAPNYQSVFHDPNNQTKIDLVLSQLKNHLNDDYKVLGASIIHRFICPQSPSEALRELQSLYPRPMLTFDIETAGLGLQEAEIVSISFAWSKHEGLAFMVTPEIKPILKDFFTNYTGKLIAHNASFDIRNIIYQCFMTHPLDISGMLEGLHTMYRNIEDTKIITYLAVNSTSGNDLSLKNNAYEFAGNWAIDIEDASTVEPKELLKYNLIDALSTFYLYEKNYPKMVQDNQEEIYKTLMIPSLKVITQMELVGMPMNPESIQDLKKKLNKITVKQSRLIKNNKLIKEFSWKQRIKLFQETNLKLKRKLKPLQEIQYEFNPNSSKQLQELLYEYLQLPVIDLTDTKQPATGEDTLSKLIQHLENNSD